jgi:hypothetical protein
MARLPFGRLSLKGASARMSVPGPVLCLTPVNHGTDTDEAAVLHAITITVDEHVGEIRMVELDPAICPLPLPAAERESGDARIIIPNRCTAVLEIRLRFEGECVEVLAASSELHALHGLDVGIET